MLMLIILSTWIEYKTSWWTYPRFLEPFYGITLFIMFSFGLVAGLFGVSGFWGLIEKERFGAEKSLGCVAGLLGFGLCALGLTFLSRFLGYS